MPKCDFNKVAKELYRNRTLHECSSVNLLHIFRTPFLKNASGRLLLNIGTVNAIQKKLVYLHEMGEQIKISLLIKTVLH